MYSYFSDVCNVLSNSTVNNVTVLYIIILKKRKKKQLMIFCVSSKLTCSKSVNIWYRDYRSIKPFSGVKQVVICRHFTSKGI